MLPSGPDFRSSTLCKKMGVATHSDNCEAQRQEDHGGLLATSLALGTVRNPASREKVGAQ